MGRCIDQWQRKPCQFHNNLKRSCKYQYCLVLKLGYLRYRSLEMFKMNQLSFIYIHVHSYLALLLCPWCMISPSSRHSIVLLKKLTAVHKNAYSCCSQKHDIHNSV